MKRTLLTVNILSIFASVSAMADESENIKKVSANQEYAPVSFDAGFLNVENSEVIDLSRFSKESSALPGTYTVEIQINNQLAFKDSIKFVEQEDGRVRPCFSLENLKKFNLNNNIIESLKDNSVMNKSRGTYYLTDLIPDALVDFDSNQLRLVIEIPQAKMEKTARGAVHPDLWDKGINGLLLGYNINSYQTDTRGEKYDSLYAGLNAQLNLNGWYFKHEGFYNSNDDISEYKSISNYVQRDIPQIKGRVRIGEMNTSTLSFNTLPIVGAELFNDNQMLPVSRQGYAPEIRGIAKTNAKVTVRQNSQIIYETTVTPGEFVIDDLYPTGASGDLDVLVVEADGTTQSFKAIYTSIPELLRAGAHNYHLAVGKVEDDSLSYNPFLLQGSYQRGLNNYVTGYTGLQYSPKYTSILLGTAWNTPLGALSTDVTQSWTDLPLNGKVLSGQSYQIGFSKFVPNTQTNLSIAAYRYATENYFDYQTALRSIDAEEKGLPSYNIWRPKNRFNITVNQNLPAGWGQVYATGYTQEYWNNEESDLQFQLGYSNNFRFINYNVSAGRVRDTRGNMDTNWLFNVSMPLSVRKQPVNISAGISDNYGNQSQNGSVSTTFGNNSEFSAGLNINSSENSDTQLSLNGGYRSPFSNITATYGHSNDYKNLSLGLQGTIVSWKDGIAFTPYTGDTFAIVEAKDAYGAKVGNYPGIRIDHWGHAAVPYLTPYSMNEISIDPKGLPQSIELDGTKARVAPYKSAISKIQFNTRKGYPLLITAKTADGGVIPFGSDVQTSLGTSVGSVGQMGQIFANVDQKTDVLNIRWGSNNNQQCVINYDISKVADQIHNDLIPLSLNCE